MNDRLTLATTTGLPFLVLAFHVATGLVALLAGLGAVVARKGGTWHRRAGLVFVGAMLSSGIAIAFLSTLEGKSPGGGLIIVYLVASAWATVQPRQDALRRVNVGLMTMALLMAADGYVRAFLAIGAPSTGNPGSSSGTLFVVATMLLLAGRADLRMIRAGGFRGSERLARHLGRMCIALFIASGSFFIGQMKFIPEPIRIVPVLIALGVSPLVVWIYWRSRVRAGLGPVAPGAGPTVALAGD